MSFLIRRYGYALTGCMVASSAIWIFGMVILPNLMMVDLSFRLNLPVVEIGGPKDVYTFTNYLTLIHNQIHYAIFFKTIWGSAFVTLCAFVVCYPIAYFLAQEAKGQQAS